ncbi:MAG: helix-turn-helix domain-containing protein [Kiloniellaceae bacterium]|jgi:transcriptional regulator with XRE-family HTH domain|nr:helix-turn-helix domain-containing protein [Kiloniellaceae bacterium]
MTPFGEKLRAIRAARGLALKDMAAGLQVSPAYLSAMEHGRRGKPSRRFVHRVCQYLGIIWDEAEELQRLADLSHPRVVVDTAGLSVKATLFANLLADRIAGLEEDKLDRLLKDLDPAGTAGTEEGAGTS